MSKTIHLKNSQLKNITKNAEEDHKVEGHIFVNEVRP